MIITPDADSTILTWRGMTVSLVPPPQPYYCYLIHFQQPYKHARHYLGATGALDMRLVLHRSGHGARLMEVVNDAGISWELARLWRVDSWEESRDLEHTLKQQHNSPRLCPICQEKPVDLLVSMRQGHWPLFLHDQTRPRRPMTR
jgi:predicted GIY-YIG superfamily endonuclease